MPTDHRIEVEAPEDLIRQLGLGVLKEIATRMRTAPSGELLGVARSFLKDQGVYLRDPADVRRLHALYRLFVRTLAASMESPGGANASVLAECRQFLIASGAMKDLNSARSQANALHELSSASIPFKGTLQ